MAKAPKKKTARKTVRKAAAPAKPRRAAAEAAPTPDAAPKASRAARAPASPPKPAVPKPAAPPKPPTSHEKSRAFAIEAARLASDDKCTGVVVLDVRGLSQIADFIIVASGTSDRQMRSVLDHIDELGQKSGFGMVRSNTDERATWLLADFVDVIVHLFEPNTRAHYDLEMMWGDAPKVEWERPQDTRRRPELASGA